MPDGNDPSLRVPIVITSDDQAAKDAAASIKEVGDAAKAAAPEAAKLNESEKEGTKAAGDLKHEKKELIDQLRVLSREFPILGEAIHIVKNPFVALAVAVAMVKSALDSMNESTKEMESRMAPFERMTELAGKLPEIAAGLDREKSRWVETFEAITKGASAAADAHARLNRELERKKRFEDETSDAQMALGLAQIDEQEAKGLLSPAEAIGRRAGLRQESASRKIAAATAARSAQMTGMGSAIAGLSAEEAAMRGELPGAEANLKAAADKEAQAKKFAAETEKEAERTKADLQAKLNEARAARPGEVELSGQFPFWKQLSKGERDARIEELTEAIKVQTAIIDGAKQEAEKTTGMREAAQGRVSSLRSGINDRATQRGVLERERDELRRDDQMERDLGPARANQRRAGDIRTGIDVNRAAMQEAQEMKRLFDEYQRALADMSRAIAESLRENSPKTIAALEAARAEIDRLNVKLDTLGQQQKNGRL